MMSARILQEQDDQRNHHFPQVIDAKQLTLHKRTRCCPQGEFFFCLGFNNLCFSPKKVGEFCFHGSKFHWKLPY